MKSTRWEIAEPNPAHVEHLSGALDIPSLLGQILWNRGYVDEPSARLFLNCQLRDLGDPFEIIGIERAVQRTIQALERNESITLYGDYDVDGVASVGILYRVLSSLLEHSPKFPQSPSPQLPPSPSLVRTFLPDRFDEGYGLTSAGVERCLAEDQPNLLIVLDCGTNSRNEVRLLQEKGVDVIIIDHHEPTEPAEPVALVNYKLQSTTTEARSQKTDGRRQETEDRRQDQKLEIGNPVNPVKSIENPDTGSALSPPSSVLSPLSSVLRPPSSVLNPLSSVLSPPSSALRTEYCTAGLVFKFCHALLKQIRNSKTEGGAMNGAPGRPRGVAPTILENAAKIDLKDFLDLVALATVADIAPLSFENRILVRHGLRQMASTRWSGLRALMRVAAVKNEPTVHDCGFKLGPRVNAAGRLESAMAALQLVLSEDDEKANDLAHQLNDTNRDRQIEEARVLAEAREDAISQLQSGVSQESAVGGQRSAVGGKQFPVPSVPSPQFPPSPSLEPPLVLVLARPGWHEGVVGIVASRIMREFYLPTFVIALDSPVSNLGAAGGQETHSTSSHLRQGYGGQAGLAHKGVEEQAGRGSGRSVEGFNLAAAIEATRSFLLRGGGHAMAAGVSLKAGEIEAWRGALQRYAMEQLKGKRLQRIIRLDAEVKLAELSLALVENLKKLEPCGIGNPRPLLVAKKVEVASEPKRVGAAAQHLKLWLRQEGVAVDAIAFGKGGMPIQKGQKLDLVFELECNEYQGRKKIQMNVREIALCE